LTTDLDHRRPLGATALRVSPLGLGGGALGGLYRTVDEEAAIGAVHEAYAAGVRYFDTAPLYGHGRSEQRLGRALADLDRSTVVVGTKVGLAIEPLPATGEQVDERYADPFLLDGRYDFSRDGVLRSLEGSLERLGLDRVDVVYIHDPDEADSALAPGARTGADHFGAVMEGAYPALHELREQGVIGAIGVGLNGTEMLARFVRAADFDCLLLAGRYTLLEQQGLDDLLPLCVERHVSLVIGGVFNSGILATGAVAGATYDYEPADAAMLTRVRAIEDLCDRHGVRLAAAALQFPLAHPAVATVIPGVRDGGEVRRNAEDASAVIPPAFWDDLRQQQLIDPAAPVPVPSSTTSS
jgi:D-threo-aldose 1-dehydrogenase